MAEYAVRDLRNDTARVLARVNAGEDVVITVRGRPAARLVPVKAERNPIRKEDLVVILAEHQADPALRAELEDLVGENTDEMRSSRW